MKRKLLMLVSLVSAALLPVVAQAVLYTWKPNVETGNWRASNWNYTCPPSSTCNTYPDDDNDDALIVVGQNTNFQRTIAINNDCIDDFTFSGDTESGEQLLELVLECDGSGPKTLRCTTVTIIGVGDHEEHTRLRVTDGAELTTAGACE